MKRPVCRLCGVAHYSHEPHKFGKDDVEQSDAGPVPLRPVAEKPRPVVSGDRADGPQGSAGGHDPSEDAVQPERIEVAKHVLSSAERHARWRANQIEKDPEGFRKREANRIARIRAGPKSPD